MVLASADVVHAGAEQRTKYIHLCLCMRLRSRDFDLETQIPSEDRSQHRPSFKDQRPPRRGKQDTKNENEEGAVFN
jgi:hypothetical protein